MNTTEIVALASVLVSVGMNTALYIHLSATVRSELRDLKTDIRDETRGLHQDIKLLTGKVLELMAREH
jgi:hypothetical protein